MRPIFLPCSGCFVLPQCSRCFSQLGFSTVEVREQLEQQRWCLDSSFLATGTQQQRWVLTLTVLVTVAGVHFLSVRATWFLDPESNPGLQPWTNRSGWKRCWPWEEHTLQTQLVKLMDQENKARSCGEQGKDVLLLPGADPESNQGSLHYQGPGFHISDLPDTHSSHWPINHKCFLSSFPNDSYPVSTFPLYFGHWVGGTTPSYSFMANKPNDALPAQLERTAHHSLLWNDCSDWKEVWIVCFGEGVNVLSVWEEEHAYLKGKRRTAAEIQCLPNPFFPLMIKLPSSKGHRTAKV